MFCCVIVNALRKPKKDLHLLAIEPNVNVKLEIYIYILLPKYQPKRGGDLG